MPVVRILTTQNNAVISGTLGARGSRLRVWLSGKGGIAVFLDRRRGHFRQPTWLLQTTTGGVG